jgi:hypothetical protein
LMKVPDSTSGKFFLVGSMKNKGGVYRFASSFCIS